jgi:uncharacterized protein (DUF433 family)
MVAKSTRRRWQVELRPGDEEAVELVCEAFGAENEAQAGRDLLTFWKRVVDAIRTGHVISLHRADDAAATDAFPEITRALRPDASYDFLVRVPHPWRKQLVFKGRRLTPGHLVAEMRANEWDIDRAASEFDLDRRAVVEALHYVERYRGLIAAEAAEERRRTKSHFDRAAAAR